MANRPRIVIAMSGGVDSTVAAALLVEQGFDVIGMMLRLWSETDQKNDNRCCNPDSISSARQAANSLNIPFYVIDSKKEFRGQVVDYFINGYTQGVTPNPCVKCNKNIRWGFLFDKAQQAGADYMATGHYARVVINKTNEYSLLRGQDSTKDQSYVLHILSQTQLSKTKFPLGELTKYQVRQLASNLGLPVFNRQESQDLCFLGNDSYQSFLLRQTPDVKNPGPFVTGDGDEIGEHQGLAFYTIGQRKGLGISASHPLYVIDKNISTNTIILGSRDELARKEFRIAEINWITGLAPTTTFRCSVQTRYRSKETPCFVTPLATGEAQITILNPIPGITPGQAAVFYDGDTCLGGGIIQI